MISWPNITNKYKYFKDPPIIQQIKLKLRRPLEHHKINSQQFLTQLNPFVKNR